MLIVFRTEVIELAFGRGAFNNKDIEVTQGLLGIYAVGLLFMAFRSTLNNVFYSMKDTKTPAVNASVGAILNIILNLTLPLLFGVKGIAMSSTITAIFITSSLMWKMVRNFKEINMMNFYNNIKRILFSGIIMFVGISIYHNFVNGYSSFFTFLMGCFIAIIIYFVCVITFKVPIAIQIINMMYSKKR